MSRLFRGRRCSIFTHFSNLAGSPNELMWPIRSWCEWFLTYHCDCSVLPCMGCMRNFGSLHPCLPWLKLWPLVAFLWLGLQGAAASAVHPVPGAGQSVSRTDFPHRHGHRNGLCCQCGAEGSFASGATLQLCGSWDWSKLQHVGFCRVQGDLPIWLQKFEIECWREHSKSFDHFLNIDPRICHHCHGSVVVIGSALMSLSKRSRSAPNPKP